MGQGASVQWSEASWKEAIKEDYLAISNIAPSPNDGAENSLSFDTMTSKLDNLFITQVANNKEAKIDDVLKAIELVIGFASEKENDPQSGILLCRALHALCVLGVGASHRTSCQRKILKSGGVDMILNVLKKQESILAQRHALSALATVICRHLPAQRKAIDLNAIEACCNAMKVAQTNADETGSGELAVIAERGFTALTALAAGNPEGKSALLKKSSNALLCIVNTMEAFAPAAAVQLAGCVTLATLSRGDALRKEQVAMGGGLSCVISAMNFHSGVSNVQREAVKALANMVSHSTEAKEFATSQGCIDSVLDCMDSFMGAGKVVEPALIALSNFCCGPSSTPDIQKSNLQVSPHSTQPGSSSSALSTQYASRRHIDPLAPHIVASIEKAKSAAASRRTLIMNNGGLDLILGAMRVHVRENVGIAHAGCCALGALGGGNNVTVTSSGGGGASGVVGLTIPSNGRMSSAPMPKSPVKSPKSPSKLSKSGPFFFGHDTFPRPMTPDPKPPRLLAPSLETNDLKNYLSFQDAHQDQIGAVSIREEIRREGGLRAVVDAMMFHPKAMSVQLHGCLALAVLWRFPPSSKHGSTRSRLNEEDLAVEERINDVIPDAVHVVTQVLKAITIEKYFGSPSGLAEITTNTPLAQAACLAVNALAKASGKCRYLLAKEGVVDLLVATIRVFSLSSGKIPRSKLVSSSSSSFSFSSPSSYPDRSGTISSSGEAAMINDIQDSGTPRLVKGSIVTVASPQVACAALEAIGSLALLGCSDDSSNLGLSAVPKSALVLNKSNSQLNIINTLDTLNGSSNNDMFENDNDGSSALSIEYENESQSVDIEKVLLVSGVKSCVPLVVATMRAHLSRVDIQQAGCLALEGLAYESSRGSAAHVGIHGDFNGNVNGRSTSEKNHRRPSAAGSFTSITNSKQKVVTENSLATHHVDEIDIYEVITRAGGLDVIGEARRHHLSDSVISRVAQDAANRQGRWRFCLVPV